MNNNDEKRIEYRTIGTVLKYSKDLLKLEAPVNLRVKYTINKSGTEIYDMEVDSVQIAVKNFFRNNAKKQLTELAMKQAIKWLDENKEAEIKAFSDGMSEIKDKLEEKLQEEIDSENGE